MDSLQSAIGKPAGTRAQPYEGDTIVEEPGADLAQPADPIRQRRLKTLFRVLTLIGLLGIVVIAVLGFTSGVFSSVESLRTFVSGFGILAPIVFVLAGSLEAVLPIIPGSMTVISAPIIFGHIGGTICAYAATCLGSLLVFAISRYAGRDLLTARFQPSTIERYSKWLDHPKFTRYFAIVIALPLAPDDVLCYLAGLTSMRWRTYLLIILLCKPWGVIAYTSGVLAILKAVFPWLGV